MERQKGFDECLLGKVVRRLVGPCYPVAQKVDGSLVFPDQSFKGFHFSLFSSCYELLIIAVAIRLHLCSPFIYNRSRNLFPPSFFIEPAQSLKSNLYAKARCPQSIKYQ
jgi:hypothetical protein